MLDAGGSFFVLSHALHLTAVESCEKGENEKSHATRFVNRQQTCAPFLKLLLKESKKNVEVFGRNSQVCLLLHKIKRPALITSTPFDVVFFDWFPARLAKRSEIRNK